MEEDKTVLLERIKELEAQAEQLELRAQRADECIVAFEEATGGLPKAVNMGDRIKDLEAQVERHQQLCEYARARLIWAANLYSQAGDESNTREQYHELARQARAILMNDVAIRLRRIARSEGCPVDFIKMSELRECFGEAIHTAFRKGSDTADAWAVWQAIKAMDNANWGRCLDWALDTIWQTYGGGKQAC